MTIILAFLGVCWTLGAIGLMLRAITPKPKPITRQEAANILAAVRAPWRKR